MLYQVQGLIRRLDKRVHHTTINHGALHLTHDSHDDRQLGPEEAMIDVATDGQATTGNTACFIWSHAQTVCRFEFRDELFK
jgi:hypothetical protein